MEGSTHETQAIPGYQTFIPSIWNEPTKTPTVIFETRFSCEDDEHKFFALEPIGDEATKTVKIPAMCTLCGSLVVHTIKL